MMNKELKTKWIAALRSGEYKQGTNVLRDEDNRFCCLGVLCDLMIKEGKGEWEDEVIKDELINSRIFKYKESEHHKVLPTTLAKELEIDISPSGDFKNLLPVSPYKRQLAKANDDGIDFETIAKAIEQDDTL